MEASRGISNGAYPDLRTSPFYDNSSLNGKYNNQSKEYYVYETGEAELPPTYDEVQASKHPTASVPNTNTPLSADAANALPSIYNAQKNGFAESVTKLLNKIEEEAKKNLPENKSDQIKAQPKTKKKKNNYKTYQDSSHSSGSSIAPLFSLNVDKSQKGVFIGSNNTTVNNNNSHNNKNINVESSPAPATQRAETRKTTSKTKAEEEAEKKAKKEKEDREFIFKVIGVASVLIITLGSWFAAKLEARKDVLKEKKETINEQDFNLNGYQEANEAVVGHQDWTKLKTIISKNKELNDLQKKRTAFDLKCVVSTIAGAGISLVGAYFGSMIVVAGGGVVIGGTGIVALYNHSYNKENDKVVKVSKSILELVKEAREIAQKLKPAN